MIPVIGGGRHQIEIRLGFKISNLQSTVIDIIEEGKSFRFGGKGKTKKEALDKTLSFLLEAKRVIEEAIEEAKKI